MKKNLQFIESLEARVAPAVLVNGGNLLGGSGNPTTGETSTGGNTVTLIKVLSGQALVFFDSTGHDITGISVGKHTKLDITGNVFGDIVTNLLPNGHLTDSDHNPANGEDGGILLGINIKGITTHKLGTENGDINRIISGGDAKNINVSGQLKGLYAGDGVFRDGSTIAVSTGPVDYNSVMAGLQNQFLLTQSLAESYISANINKVVVQTADQLEIFAGRWPYGYHHGSGPSGRQHHQRDDHPDADRRGHEARPFPARRRRRRRLDGRGGRQHQQLRRHGVDRLRPGANRRRWRGHQRSRRRGRIIDRIDDHHQFPALRFAHGPRRRRHHGRRRGRQHFHPELHQQR